MELLTSMEVCLIDAQLDIGRLVCVWRDDLTAGGKCPIQ